MNSSSQWDDLREKYQKENAEVKLMILKRLHAVVLARQEGKLPDKFLVSINFRSRKVEFEELDSNLTTVLEDLKYGKRYIYNFSQKRNNYRIEISKPLRH